MNFEYSLLFDLQLFHTYFQDGKFKTIAVKPSKNTNTLLDIYLIKFKQHENGITIYHPKVKSTGEFLKYMIEDLGIEKLQFDITTQEPNIYDYTDIPLDNIVELKFSNKSDSAGSKPNALALTQESSDDEIIDNFGTIVIQMEDLIRQQAEGKNNFEIHFEARKTQWNYIIIPQTASYDDLVIESDSKYTFSGPEDILVQGKSAIKFSSGTQLIPLQERSTIKNVLFHERSLPTGEIVKKVLIPSLPHAGSTGFEKVIIDGKKEAASAIFIYV